MTKRKKKLKIRKKEEREKGNEEIGRKKLNRRFLLETVELRAA